MAWQMSGTYLATCNCQLLCPCPVDSPPTGPGGQCHGLAVFDVREGNLDDTDLSGTAKLAYRFNPDMMSYVSYSKGYKAGGFNLDRVTNEVGVVAGTTTRAAAGAREGYPVDCNETATIQVARN